MDIISQMNLCNAKLVIKVVKFVLELVSINAQYVLMDIINISNHAFKLVRMVIILVTHH